MSIGRCLLRRACTGAATASLIILASTVDAGSYEFEIFEVPGAPITGGRGINDTGCEAGYYQTDASDFSTAHAIRRCAGTIVDIDPPTSIGDRRAFDINDAGVVVGSALRSSGQDGFELIGGLYSWVEYPGADQTVIRGVNNLGEIVGEYEGSDGIRHAFARLGGTLINVDVPGAAESRARGINDLGEIVGHYDDTTGSRHGFRRSTAGAYSTLDFPGAVSTVTGGINNTGDVVGTYFDAGGSPHGFVWTAGVFEPCDVPGAAGTLSVGINEAGRLTGEFVDAKGTRRGFVAIPILFEDGFESGNTNAWSMTVP
ncbi:MAG: hypothetical protein AAF604_07580 [Acidobacteriota bacterium]